VEYVPPHVDSGPRPQGHLLLAYRGASDRDRDQDQAKQIKKKPPDATPSECVFLLSGFGFAWCVVSAIPRCQKIEIIITA